FVRFWGTLLAVPELMSAARLVPPDVPSELHSSYPCPASLAVKNSVPSTLVRYITPLPAGLPLMSRTSIVPAAVPSDLHSSEPCVPSFAVKNRVPPTLVRYTGSEFP